jgi:hypothetical protein
MIQYKNLDFWYGCTSNRGMQNQLMHECYQRKRAFKYIILAKHIARLEHEMQQMWEEELM